MSDLEKKPDQPEEEKKEKKSKRDVEAFLKKARKRFASAATAESKNRESALEDLKFKSGDQWPAGIKASRAAEQRPCLTINKMKTFVHQVTNDQRQNRPAINVSPVGDRSERKTAEMLRGLIRHIERDSDADIAYDTGFENAVSNGFGYWRIVTEYESSDSFDQVAKVKRIRNPFTVYLDPNHIQPEASDIEWGFVSEMIDREDFKAQNPGKDSMPWDETGVGDLAAWSDDKRIRIAEYFEIEKETKTLVALANGHVGYEDELDDEVKKQIAQDSSYVLKRREAECKKVKWYKITGKEILEEKEWAGQWIPIIKCIGDEIDIEGKVILSGVIRDAKDPARMYNYWSTSETEMVALAPKAPFIMAEGQVEGHEARWNNANNKSYPYLLYKETTIGGHPAPMPQRQPFAGPPMGIIQAKAAAADDMRSTTGIRFDATRQERLSDESGRAMQELKRTADLGSFHYVDNLSRSLKHTGRILIDLIPKIYDTPRILTILREDGSEEQVKVDPSLQKAHQEVPHNGKTIKAYNIKMGQYEVAVTIGPSYATKRQESAESMIGFVKAVPQAGTLIGDLIAKNMDWPGAEQIAGRLAAMLPPQVLGAEVKDLPQHMQGMVKGLLNTVQGQNKQMMLLMKELNDKTADRNVSVEKINKDFEAKLIKVAADLEKFHLQHVSNLTQQVGEVTSAVKTMEGLMSKGPPGQQPGSPPTA